MRTVSRHRIVVCALAMLVAPALAGCAAEQAPAPSRTAAATDAPVFASDEEALAAATKAYAAYLKVVDAVLAHGGGDTHKLADVLLGEALAAELRTAEKFEKLAYRSVGVSLFDSVVLQDIDEVPGGTTTVRAYLCSDVTSVDVVDASGSSIVPSGRPDRFPLQITYETVEENSTRLLISSSETWTGTNFC